QDRRRRARIGKFPWIDRPDSGDRFALPIPDAVNSRYVDRQGPARHSLAAFFQQQRRLAAIRADYGYRLAALGQAAPLDLEPAAARLGTQCFLLEVGFLHQPVGEAAKQFRLRPTALEAARPQPDMVRIDLRNTPVLDAVQDHKRLR